jgi:hypothetical protein
MLELAKLSKSAEEIAALLNRSPEAVRRMAVLLGVSLKDIRRSRRS